MDIGTVLDEHLAIWVLVLLGFALVVVSLGRGSWLLWVVASIPFLGVVTLAHGAGQTWLEITASVVLVYCGFRAFVCVIQHS